MNLQEKQVLQVIQKVFNKFDNFVGQVLFSSTDWQFFRKTIEREIYSIYTNPREEIADKHPNELSIREDNESCIPENFNKVYVEKGWVLKRENILSKPKGEYFLLWKNKRYTFVHAKNFVLKDVSKRNAQSVDVHYIKFQKIDSFYWLRGKHFFGTGFEVRFYLNIDLSNSNFVTMLKELMDTLDFYGIPFAIKYVVFPNNFFRSDNTVLFLGKEHYHFIYPILKDLNQKYGELFLAQIPLFTHDLKLKGIGFAESPYSSLSFGTLKSQQLTDAIINYCANANGQFDVNACFESAKGFLNEQKTGLSTGNFHKNPGTNFPYTFFSSSKRVEYNKKKCEEHECDYLKLANGIGNVLLRNAIVTTNKNGNAIVDWLTVKSKFENACEGEDCIDSYSTLDNSYENGKLGIVYFLALLSYLNKTDLILREICKIGLEDLNRAMTSDSTLELISTLLSDEKSRDLKFVCNNIPAIFQKDKDFLDNLLCLEMSIDPNEDIFRPQINNGFSSIGLAALKLYVMTKLNQPMNQKNSQFVEINNNSSTVQSLLARIA